MDTPVATEKLIARKDGAIGWVIFNNPQKRNAMSLDMYEATAAALEDYARDPAIRVVILKGRATRRLSQAPTSRSSRTSARTRSRCGRPKPSRSAATRRSANAPSR